MLCDTLPYLIIKMVQISMEIKPIDWEDLLESIESHLVVPVIGPELCLFGFGNPKRTLYDSIAQELVRRLEWSKDEPALESSLETVVATYLREPESQSRSLYRNVLKILTNLRWPAPGPLRQLAAIEHFDLYLTVTFDSLMEQAINEVRFNGKAKSIVRAYSLISPASENDLPAAYKPVYVSGNRPPAVPAIYHLFGKASILEDDYALREEVLLRFYQNLQIPDRRPKNLFDVLGERDLLVLGTGFPGWLTRFFLATAKREQFFNGKNTGVLADYSSMRDQSLVLFLERNRTSIYSGNAIEFVDELYKLWKKRFPGENCIRSGVQSSSLCPEIPESYDDLVFISYAREDEEYAEAIWKALASVGVNVWFDKALESGHGWEERTSYLIGKCSAFIPVISQKAIAEPSRFLYSEWNKAIKRAEEFKGGHRFIHPVIVDHTKTEALKEPFPKFAACQCTWLEQGQLPRRFLDSVIAAVGHVQVKGAGQ